MCGASSGTHGGKEFSVEVLKEGETVICSPNGDQCHAVRCFSTNRDLGRMLPWSWILIWGFHSDFMQYRF